MNDNKTDHIALNRDRLRLSSRFEQILGAEYFFGIAPDQWRLDGKPDLLVSAFNYIAPPQNFMAMGYFLQLKNAVVVFSHGKIERGGEFEKGRIKNNLDGQASFTPRLLDGAQETSPDWWVVVIQPLIASDHDVLTVAQEERVGITGMISATMGPAAVYHLEVESIYVASGNTLVNVISPGVVPDFAMRDSTPAEDKFLKLKHLARAMQNLDDEFRTRVNISLHWFDLGHRTQGVEQFINYWVALEALCLDGDSDVKPIYTALGEIYKITPKEAKKLFGIGRILNVRSNILHGRYRISPSAQLSFYLREVFSDLLRFKLELEGESRAQKFLGGKTFDEMGFLEQGPPKFYRV
jgi:hypothetical protein